MPNSYSINDSINTTGKQKTPEEIQKENRDTMMEYYLKILENEHKDMQEIVADSLREVNDFLDRMIRDGVKAGAVVTSG